MGFIQFALNYEAQHICILSPSKELMLWRYCIWYNHYFSLENQAQHKAEIKRFFILWIFLLRCIHHRGCRQSFTVFEHNMFATQELFPLPNPRSQPKCMYLQLDTYLIAYNKLWCIIFCLMVLVLTSIVWELFCLHNKSYPSWFLKEFLIFIACNMRHSHPKFCVTFN